MPASKPTPEEKLFSVIQGAKHPPIRGRARALSLAQAAKTALAWIGPFDLPRVNQLLGVIVIGLGMACVLQLFLWPSPDRLLRQVEGPAPAVVPAPLEGLRPTEEYLQVMARQDPFRVGETPVTAASVAAIPQRDPREAIADLRLVGIAWGDDPVAMIERSEQTHVLRPGEVIGGATVKEIFHDHVILQVEGRDVELF